MGITVIGITHPGQVGALPGGTNVLVLADDGTYADEFLDTDFGAHQLVVRAHGHGSAFFGVADKARELGAESDLLRWFPEPQPFRHRSRTRCSSSELAPGGPIAFNAPFGEWMVRLDRGRRAPTATTWTTGSPHTLCGKAYAWWRKPRRHGIH